MINDGIYIIGGCANTDLLTYLQTCTVSINETWLYNITTQLWTQLPSDANFPPGTFLVANPLQNAKIVVYSNTDFVYSSIYVLDITTSSWSHVQLDSISAVPTGRSTETIVSYNNNFYMFGGGVD